MPRSTNVQNLLSCRAIVPPLTTGSMTTDQVAPHLPITHPFEPTQQPHLVVVHQAHPPSQHTEMTYPSGAEPPYQGHQLGHVNFTNTSRRVVRSSTNDVIAETGNGHGGAVGLAHRVRS
jgi:hypothetical protein